MVDPTLSKVEGVEDVTGISPPPPGTRSVKRRNCFLEGSITRGGLKWPGTAQKWPRPHETNQNRPYLQAKKNQVFYLA